MDEDVHRAMKQYRGWVVVEVEPTPAADGQHILRIQSPDGTQETLVTSEVVILGDE